MSRCIVQSVAKFNSSQNFSQDSCPAEAGGWQIFGKTGDFLNGDTKTTFIQTNLNILLIDNVYISIQEVDKVNFIILNKIYNTRGVHQSTTAAADLTDLCIYWVQINLWYCEWLGILYFIFGELRMSPRLYAPAI